jgi:hypothetical protein
MGIPDSVQFSCPNCAATIKLRAGKHTASHQLECDLCGQIMSLSGETWNWLRDGGFFLDEGPGEGPSYGVPMKRIGNSKRMVAPALPQRAPPENTPAASSCSPPVATTRSPRQRLSQHAAAACASGVQQGVVRQCAVWTGRSRWGTGEPQGLPGARASRRTVCRAEGGQLFVVLAPIFDAIRGLIFWMSAGSFVGLGHGAHRWQLGLIMSNHDKRFNGCQVPLGDSCTNASCTYKRARLPAAAIECLLAWDVVPEEHRQRGLL